MMYSEVQAFFLDMVPADARDNPGHPYWAPSPEALDMRAVRRNFADPVRWTVRKCEKAGTFGDMTDLWRKLHSQARRKALESAK